MGLGGCVAGGNRSLVERIVSEEATCNNHVGRPIYELCTGADRMECSRKVLRRWDQEYGPTQADRGVGRKKKQFLV